jgi:glucokinase
MTRSASLALVADIGGTHARFALADIDTREIHQYGRFKVSEFDSLEAAATNYLASVAHRPTRACFAIAGPVSGNEIRLTNANWSFTRAGVRDATGVSFLSFVNDYEALAHSLPLLTDRDYRQIGGEDSVEHATKAVVGPGTGLGVAALAWSQTGWTAISGEGGHVSFAVENVEEFEILTRMRREFGHISAERLISGPGLSHVYSVLCEMSGQSPAKLSAAAIVERTQNGMDPVAKKTTELFAEWLGRFAGDAALMFGAHGGVYVAGGIPPRILGVLITGRFRKGFESKGRMTDYVKRIPTYVIVIEDAGLKGAAAILAASG